MGQNESIVIEEISKKLEPIREQYHKTSKEIPNLFCNYDEFVRSLREINSLCQQVPPYNGKKVYFAVENGTDNTVFWRSKVRIAVIEVDCNSSTMKTKRLLTLGQFLRVFSTVQEQLASALRHTCLQKSCSMEGTSGSTEASASSSQQCSCVEKPYSSLWDEILDSTNKNNERLAECCICFERTPDILLSCAHAFCSTCIQEWNAYQTTCPICREFCEADSESWVISDIPDSGDIWREISSVFSRLSQESNGPT